MASWDSDTDGYGSDHGYGTDYGPDDDSYDYENKCKVLKEELSDKLDGICNYGDFASMTEYSQHVNPGLEVAGSLIPLPLVERDASMIKSRCEKAPFECGDDTVVDESRRKNWQINADLFRCSNPAWPGFLNSVLCEMLQKLGVSQYDARAVPSKLILYEEGSCFRLHNDSEKPRGMIGTLMISFPSKYEGGEIHLSHSSKCHVFATADSTGFDLAALAWYSDVEHEIRPITSGHRLVMTYNLVQRGLHPPSADLLTKQQAQLQGALHSWASVLGDKKAIYMLDHKYSNSSLSIQDLKGRDPHIIRCLEQACQETGFYVLLAMVGTYRMRGVTVNCDGVPEDALDLDYVTTVEGNKIADSVHLDDCRILGPDKERHADTEDEDEFDGNESIPSENGYQDSALLIVPREGLVDFVKSQQSASELLQMVCFSSPVSPGEATARHQFRVTSFLGSILWKSGSWVNEAHLLKQFLRACKVWSSQRLHDEAVRRAVMVAQDGHCDDLSSQSFTINSTGSTIAEISEVLADIANEFFLHHTDQEWSECLGELVRNLHTDSLDDSLDLVGECLCEELEQSFRRWRSSVPKSKFETKDSLTALDLSFILGLIQSNFDDDEWISARLLPKLGQCADKELVYSLLQEYSAKNGHSTLKDEKSLARRLLNATLSKLRLEIGDFEPELQRPSQGSSYLGRTANSAEQDMSSVNSFVRLLHTCFKCGLEEQGMELLSNSYEKLKEGINRLPREGWNRNDIMKRRHEHISGVPNNAPARKFLKILVGILHQNMNPPPFMPPPFVKKLFLLLFKRYILPYKPDNPPKPCTTWSHQPRHCDKGDTCHECSRIQNFIRADQRHMTFNYAKSIRSHLENMLPTQHYSCTTIPGSNEGKKCRLLRVVKIGVDTEYEEDMRKFDDKLRLYKEKRISPFRQPVVQRLLGDETYKSLIMLDSVPSAARNSRVSTKRGAGESPDQPASTRQRTGDAIN